jgi:hypothetical protein
MIRYICASLLLLTASQQAAAYLDPGTGSMILQGLIAGVAVAGFTIKSYWYKIRAYFGKEARTSLLDDEDDPPTPKPE